MKQLVNLLSTALLLSVCNKDYGSGPTVETAPTACFSAKQSRTSSSPSTADTIASEEEATVLPNHNNNGQKEGLWTDVYPNGQLKSEGNYKNGMKEGLHKEWSEDGTLTLEGFYQNGKANGLMKWYHEKGHLAGEGKMEDDKRIGPLKICDIQENGFCIDAHFKNGKRDGTWKIYHENERDKVWKEQEFKEDKMVSEKCWDENGNTINCTTF